MKLRALRAGVYATRRLQAGDVFDVPPVIAKIMMHQRRAEIAPEQIEPPPKPKTRAKRRAVPEAQPAPTPADKVERRVLLDNVEDDGTEQ